MNELKTEVVDLTLVESTRDADIQLVPKGEAPAGSPVGIMLAALERGVSPADLREMLALQREWRADEARNAFNKAMAAFKSEPVYVSKSKQVGYTANNGAFVGYKHAELSDVVAAVGPALAKHGLSHRWDVKQEANWISVTCILKHVDGHFEQCQMGGPPDASGKKNQIQQIASTVSYLQRYTLKAITGVAEGGEDDDGQGGEAETQHASQQQAEPAASEPYPQNRFERNSPKWAESVASGAQTVDAALAFLRSKNGTPDQEQQLLAAIKAASKSQVE